MAKDDKTAKATTAPAPAKPEAKATTAPESLDKTDAPVNVEAMREQIRAEEAEKLRAESAERSKAEAQRQAQLDAAKADHVEVVCSGDNVHTSKGKMVKGMTKHLPESEAAALSKKGHVKPV